jgi:hypothetical protein
MVSARLRELLEAGLDELLVTLVPVSDTAEDEQQARLMHLLGLLYSGFYLSVLTVGSHSNAKIFLFYLKSSSLVGGKNVKVRTEL